jgi:Terminase RNaseH-like domain
LGLSHSYRTLRARWLEPREQMEWVDDDLQLLITLGENLDSRPQILQGDRIRDWLIRHLLSIRSKTRGLIPLSLNRAQREYSQRCGTRNLVLKARQLGITTYVAARFFIQTISRPGTVTVQVAHDQESAEQIFKIVHRFWENLPEGTRRGALLLSHANVRQMVLAHLDSEYRVATAADANAGRGLTIHNLHCSEVARWPGSPEETLASLRAAVPKDGEIVLESTPNGAGGFFYDEWQHAGETGYTRHFFPWWYDEQYRIDGKVDPQPLTPEEQGLKDRAGLSGAQIAWRRLNRAQLRGLAIQEYAEDPVSCFLASGECVFELTAIEHALQATGEPNTTADNQHLEMWFPPKPAKEYIIGVDPAGGGAEGDYACAAVIERKTGLQCAELHGHFSPRELANQLVELGHAYNQALLVVERNNHGYGVLAYLHTSGYSNVYCQGGQAGWLTSAVTRPMMIEHFASMLAIAPALFRSPRLLQECRTFVRHADGGFRASAGAHDDCVMAMAIAQAAREAVAGASGRTSR